MNRLTRVVAGAQEALLFASLPRAQNERRKGRGDETYESNKLYVGFEFNSLARNGTSNGENCSYAGPYKAGG